MRLLKSIAMTMNDIAEGYSHIGYNKMGFLKAWSFIYIYVKGLK